MKKLYRVITLILAVGLVTPVAAAENNAKTTIQTVLQKAKESTQKIVQNKKVQRGAIAIGAILGTTVALYLGYHYVLPKFASNNRTSLNTITDIELPYDPAMFNRLDIAPNVSRWKRNAQENAITADIPNPPQRLLSIQNQDGKKITIVQGSITQEGDTNISWAITNAAKSALSGGSGVDGAIRKAAGPAPYEECQRYKAIFTNGKNVPVGSATITKAGNLEPKVKYIIHAVGPRIPKDTQPTVTQQTALYAAVTNTLYKAHKHGVRVVSIPPISSGIFGYPAQDCAKQIIDASLDFINKYPISSIQEVRLIDLQDDAQGKLSMFVDALKQRVAS